MKLTPEQRAALVEWRSCPDCGEDWPHPSVRSESCCADCRVARALAREREAVARQNAERLPTPQSFFGYE